MRTRSFSLTLAAAFLFMIAGNSQIKSPETPKLDYPDEAVVIEFQETKITFDNDGKRSREQLTRVRINSDAGLQQWGVLSLPYQSATESVEIGYVRARKAAALSLTPRKTMFRISTPRSPVVLRSTATFVRSMSLSKVWPKETRLNSRYSGVPSNH